VREGLDPTRCIAFDAEGLIIDGGIAVGLLSAEHEEEGAQEFVGDGDDGSLVPSTNDERIEPDFESRVRSSRGLCKLAEQAPDIGVALAGASGFSFAGGFVVAGTDAGPGGQAVGAAEDAHIVADFDQQHRRTHEIDARQGLQQHQGVTLLDEPFEQTGIVGGAGVLRAIVELLARAVAGQIVFESNAPDAKIIAVAPFFDAGSKR